MCQNTIAGIPLESIGKPRLKEDIEGSSREMGQKPAIALCGWAAMMSQRGQINYTVMTFFVLRRLSDLWAEKWRLTADSPDENAQYPGGEGHCSGEDEGEKDGNHGPLRPDFPPEDGDSCKTGYVEDYEYRENQDLYLRHDGEDLCGFQGLNQHDHGELFSKNPKDEGCPHGLR